MYVGYIVYDAASGIILRHGTVDQEDLQHQAQEGEAVLQHDAAVPVDPACQRVDLPTLSLVDWQPPAPPDDDWRSWVWSAEVRRWVAVQTDLSLGYTVRAERDKRLAACDWVTVRAMEQGAPVPEAWAAYRQALRDVPAQPGFPAAVTWPEPPAP